MTIQRAQQRAGALLAAGLGLVGMVGCGTNSFLANPPLVADPLPVDVRWNPTVPTAEITAEIEVVINNQGGLPAKAFTVLVQVARNPCVGFGGDFGETIEGTYPVEFPDGLLAGESQLRVVEHNFNNIAGQYAVFVRVDDGRDLDETIPGSYDGETNNEYRCNDISTVNGDVVLTFDQTFITVNSPGGGDDGGDGVIIPIFPFAIDD